MRVLWVTPRLPEPPDSGGKIVTFHMVEQLALRGHEITVCSLISGGLRGASRLERLADLRPVPSTLEDRQNYPCLLISVFSDRPFVISKYWSEEAWKFIAQLLRERAYDLVHCDHLHTAPYGLRAKGQLGLPIVLTAHNVEAAVWEGVSRVERHPLRWAYFRLQWSKMRAYEAQTIAHFDGCIALSPEDAERLRALNPQIEPVVVPPGVDPDYFHPTAIPEEPGAIVFVGATDWLPNVEGLLWFYRRVWPQVKRAVREVNPKLYIVGGRPGRAIRRLANDRDVIVTGWVEDVRPYMAKAQVFIVPALVGSGVRIKILNALAMEKAIVSTSRGSEGIRADDGEAILIADTAEEFARKVVELLEDGAQRQSLGKAGVRLVRSFYCWEQAAEGIERVYQRVVGDRTGAASSTML